MSVGNKACLWLTVTLAACWVTSCGGGSGASPSSNNSSSSSVPVTVLLTSQANAQLAAYGVTFTSLSLTSESGRTVTVLDKSTGAELLHVNGTVEPLVTAQVPEDTYTSATVTVSDPGFVCIGLDSSQTLHVDYFVSPGPNATVTLPGPVTIAAGGEALQLDLEAAQSAAFPSCVQSGFEGFTATPTFELSALQLSAEPTNSGNGLALGLTGQITSIADGGATFDLTSIDGLSWPILSNGSTVYQGAAGAAALLQGQIVNVDASVQPDGALIAGRIAVEDPSPQSLTLWHGPVLLVQGSQPASAGPNPALELVPTGSLGLLATDSALVGAATAVFQTSSSLDNLESLPFKPTFDVTTVVAGQIVDVIAHVTTLANGGNYPPATTVTLVPQTVDGTILAIGSDGGFTTYTINLAADDLFAMLAQQPGQVTVLQSPQQLVVYADGSTQLLTTTSPAVGSVMRFNGLVFNDQGVLRMDCVEVLDGVPL